MHWPIIHRLEKNNTIQVKKEVWNRYAVMLGYQYNQEPSTTLSHTKYILGKY